MVVEVEMVVVVVVEFMIWVMVVVSKFFWGEWW